MTRQASLKVSIPLAALLLATAALADRSDKQGKDGSASLQLPIAGSVKMGPVPGAPFAGTLSVERFEARGDQVWAVGILWGGVPDAGTGLDGEVSLLVQ